MKSTAFFITSRKRCGQVKTLEYLSKKILRKTFLVVNSFEKAEYKEEYGNQVTILPFKSKKEVTLSDKRQFILKYCIKNKIKKFILLDDDVSFSMRENMKLKRASKKQVRTMFESLLAFFEDPKVGSVGPSQRNGNNRNENDFADNERLCLCIGYSTAALEKIQFDFSRLKLMSDYDSLITLLENGYSVKALYTFAVSQPGSNTAGGCSVYRTPKLLGTVANQLAALHPNTVRVGERKSKNKWAGFESNVRVGVTIQWKKAFDMGQKKKPGFEKFL